MKLDEAQKIADLLKENNFKEVSMAENPEELENYLPAGEIARKLIVRLDGEAISKVLTELGYKTFVEKVGVPTNPENSAFALKSTEDEETGVKKFYIQPLWHYTVVEQINETVRQSQQFQPVKEEFEEKNKQTIEEKIKTFSQIDDYVAVVVKKTGFNINKDFTVFVSYAVIENNNLVDNQMFFINDDIRPEKIEHYTTKDPLTDTAPFDFIKINLPSMDGCKNPEDFRDRRDVLRHMYKVLRGRNVVFYFKDESRFLKRMFDEEGIPAEHHYSNIIKADYGIRELIDWMEPKASLKIRKVYDRYQIANDTSENMYTQESKKLARLTFAALRKYTRSQQ